MLTEIDERSFWSKAIITDNSSCWNWTGIISGHGYGYFYIHGRLHRAHRMSWRITNGYIPDKKLVLHKCDNRTCVNPGHLYIGTQSDNMQDVICRHRKKFNCMPPMGKRLTRFKHLYG